MIRPFIRTGLAVFLLAVGFAFGLMWKDRVTFVTAEEAWSSQNLCMLYFAEQAPTSRGAEIGAQICRRVIE